MHRFTFTPAPTARLAAVMGVVVLLAGCGSPGSSDSGAKGDSTSAASDLAVCEAVPGDTLVALEDDQKLQNPDNIIPAVNAAAAAEDPELITLLNTVSAALDTQGLVALNKAVDVDRQTSALAAQAFVEEQGLAATTDVGAGRKVVVGSPNFSEGATLANLYVEVLISAGYDAVTQDVGNRELYLTDLESGSVTIVPEYVSTLAEFLNVKANGDGADSVATPDLQATVGELSTLAEGVGIIVGEPAEAQDQNAFAVTEAFAKEHDLTTLTDLATNCGGVVLGGPPECPERPFCQIGLEEAYGLDVGEFTSLDAGGPLTKEALKSGKITLGLIFSSDAALG